MLQISSWSAVSDLLQNNGRWQRGVETTRPGSAAPSMSDEETPYCQQPEYASSSILVCSVLQTRVGLSKCLAASWWHGIVGPPPLAACVLRCAIRAKPAHGSALALVALVLAPASAYNRVGFRPWPLPIEPRKEETGGALGRPDAEIMRGPERIKNCSLSGGGWCWYWVSCCSLVAHWPP